MVGLELGVDKNIAGGMEGALELNILVKNIKNFSDAPLIQHNKPLSLLG